MATPIAQLIVYDAHVGRHVEIPKPVRFRTLQSFKEFLLDAFLRRDDSSVDNIFLLTPFGIKLNFQMINEMNEVYVYDRYLFDITTDKFEALRYANAREEKMPQLPLPQSFNFSHDESEKAIPAQFGLFERWFRSIILQTDHNQRICDLIARRINYIFKSLNIIFQFVSNFVKASEKSFSGYYSSVKLLWTKSLRNTWHTHHSIMKSLPAIQFRNSKSIVLANYLDEDQFKEAAEFVNAHLPEIVEKFNALSASMNSINEETFDIDKMIESLRTESAQKFKAYESNKSATIQDIEANKAAFLEDAGEFRSMSGRKQREMYIQHKEVSERLFKASRKVYTYMNDLNEFHKNLTVESVPIFQAIAQLQLKVVTLRNEAKALMVKPQITEVSTNGQQDLAATYDLVKKVRNAEDTLSMTVDLPLLFGFTLVEKRRQFEWHDFFLKGLVNGLSEQLTIIIEQENSFQSLWIKKFGNYVKHINPHVNLLTLIPAVDVTLVNGSPSVNSNNVFSCIDVSTVVREDIFQYIEVLKSHKYEKFAAILEKNYKDMVCSTDQMNKMTRVASSLSAHAYLSSDSAKIRANISLGPENALDQNVELNLVDGLKLRIRKLENLLHQNQFRNLNNWPVVRADLMPSNFQMSLIVSGKEGQHNSLQLLQQGNTTLEKKPHKTPAKVLDASTTIDKHIDNIRLRKESVELHLQNLELLDQNKEYLGRIRALEGQLKNKNSQCDSLEAELSNRNQKLRELDQGNKERIDQMTKQQRRIEADLEIYKVKLTSNKAEFQDLVKVNSELLTDILEKEQDFASERSDLQREINELSAELDQKTEDFDKLLEAFQVKRRATQKLLGSLNYTLQSLFHAIELLCALIVEYFRELCLVTQSMGLLLIKQQRSDGAMEYRIKRVKGLRAHNTDENDTDQLPEIKTDVIKDVDEAISWLQTVKAELERVEIDSNKGKSQEDEDEEEEEEEEDVERSLEKLESHSQALIASFAKFLSSGNGEFSLLDKALKFMSFKENIQLQLHENKAYLGEGFFYNGIVKRFSDVEGYAKKLTKENKIKTAELAKAIKAQKEKISIKDFHQGDLVLFLPTIQNEEVDEDQTPWTAFNIDAPHYFLDKESQPKKNSKEWIVNRIAKIETHDVTEENVNDKTKNPYSLQAGDNWYSVLTQKI